MKKMMKCLALAIMVLTVAGTAWSWDFADHVKMAPNGQGDYLIYPFYIALNGGWETKVVVTNTAPNRSVVAHVVIYSAKTSREMFDFFIYLTPTDVFTGTLRYNATSGKTEFYTTDDSFMTSATTTPPSFASETNPFTFEVVNPLSSGCQASLQANPAQNPEPFGTSLGYIKVFEAAHTDAINSNAYFYPPGAISTVNLNLPPASKLALFQAYNDFLTAAGLAGIIPANAATNPLVLDGINVLSGHAEIRNVSTGHYASLPATALRDYNNQYPMPFGTWFGSYVGCQASVTGVGLGCSGGLPPGAVNSATGASCVRGGTAIPAACGCAATGGICQANSIGEVEAALAKDWVALPFTTKNTTLHFLTLPTKQTGVYAGDCYFSNAPGGGFGSTSNYGFNTPSPFFNVANRVTQPPAIRPSTYSGSWEAWGCFQYASANYDLTERSSVVSSIFSPGPGANRLCGEVNWAKDFAFSEGWAVYNFTGGATTNVPPPASSYLTPFDVQADLINAGIDAWYTGAPVIGAALNLTATGSLTVIPATYSNGRVAYNANANLTFDPIGGDVSYLYYQYWDEANLGSLNPVAALSYDADDIGCWNPGPPPYRVACGTPRATLTGETGFNTIYDNKFSGNRPVILSNATKTTQVAMTNVRVPFVGTGTTITTSVALTVTGCTIAPCPAAIPIGTSTTVAANGDLFVTIPVGTTITSSSALTGADGNMP